MSGEVSIGWFDPAAIAPAPDIFAARAATEIGRGRKSETVLTMEAAPSCYYTHVRGTSEVGIKRHGYRSGAGPEWHFVMATVNRPVLLMVQATEQNMMPIAMGPYAQEDDEPKKIQPVGFRAIEMMPGLAIFFDSTKYWHGYTQFPVPEVQGVTQEPPSALIIRLGKYIPHVGDNGAMIGRAVEECRAIVEKGAI